jgi:catechol 2,3-dioxygenase-like lactoylglutathione lyase family enzyme
MPISPSRIYHVNVNCSDLARSRAFYTELLGLRPLTRTTPDAPQPGGAFGLDQVQWDAWILQGDEGSDGVVLDLLEWQVPRPTGTPATVATATGFNRLCLSVPDPTPPPSACVTRERTAGPPPCGSICTTAVRRARSCAAIRMGRKSSWSRASALACRTSS